MLCPNLNLNLWLQVRRHDLPVLRQPHVLRQRPGSARWRLYNDFDIFFHFSSCSVSPGRVSSCLGEWLRRSTLRADGALGGAVAELGLQASATRATTPMLSAQTGYFGLGVDFDHPSRFSQHVSALHTLCCVVGYPPFKSLNPQQYTPILPHPPTFSFSQYYSF